MKISRYEKRTSSRKSLIALAVACVVAFAALCGALYAHRQAGTADETAATSAQERLSLDEKADAIVREMTLTEKIGQMVPHRRRDFL